MTHGGGGVNFHIHRPVPSLVGIIVAHTVQRAHTNMSESQLIHISDLPAYLKEKTGGVVNVQVKTVRNWLYSGKVESTKVFGKRYVTAESADLIVREAAQLRTAWKPTNATDSD